MKNTQDVMQQHLEAYLKRQFPQREALVLSELERTDVGYSYQTCFVSLTWKESDGPVSERLVIRVEPETGCVPPYDIRPQYEVMKRLEGTAIPIPKTVCLETGKDIIGHRFFVMEAIEGQVLYQSYLNHPENRTQLENDYISILAGMHELDWRGLGLSILKESESAAQCVRSEIARWEQVIETSIYNPLPIVSEVICWLKNNIPPADRMTLCHGDYHCQNLLARDGRVVAVLDWEMVKVGDPISDLGWACLLSNITKGFWSEHGIVESYQKACGRTVDADRLFFWKVLAHIKLAAICLAALRASMEFENPDMRQATIGIMGVPGLLDGAAQMLGF
ncbi:MAG: phosphotransferase family protein [Desulfatitalea sp.]|nr:phosphotransferase family protein [Desulfatitalea sp.]NNJ99930.1 phosphotransferase family protein [Desulfatitalea sp.]